MHTTPSKAWGKKTQKNKKKKKTKEGKRKVSGKHYLAILTIIFFFLVNQILEIMFLLVCTL